MKTLFVAGLLAFLGALLITHLVEPQPLETQLLHLQVERTMPEMANELTSEPAELQALFLAYADDPVLLAKARLTMLRYPDMARSIFLKYGDSREFMDVLRSYGEDIILPIHYFRTHEIFTLELMRGVSETTRSALGALRRMWNADESAQVGTDGTLSSDERGRYAIQFLKAEGYDFLGQFVMGPGGDVAWVQTERVLEGINSFFANGVKGLETKLHRDEAISVTDAGWAALDVAVGISAFKILRMGKAGAVGGRTLTLSERSAALGSGLWRASAIGSRLVKYGAPAVLAYIAIRHPSVINSLLGSAANAIGVPVGLVQVVGWTLILLPVLLLLRLVVGPLAWAFAGITSLLRWFDSLLRKRSPEALSA
jgi:hypothetical protein